MNISENGNEFTFYLQNSKNLFKVCQNPEVINQWLVITHHFAEVNDIIFSRCSSSDMPLTMPLDKLLLFLKKWTFLSECEIEA